MEFSLHVLTKDPAHDSNWLNNSHLHQFVDQHFHYLYMGLKCLSRYYLFVFSPTIEDCSQDCRLHITITFADLTDDFDVSKNNIVHQTI